MLYYIITTKKKRKTMYFIVFYSWLESCYWLMYFTLFIYKIFYSFVLTFFLWESVIILCFIVLLSFDNPFVLSSTRRRRKSHSNDECDWKEYKTGVSWRDFPFSFVFRVLIVCVVKKSVTSSPKGTKVSSTIPKTRHPI